MNTEFKELYTADISRYGTAFVGGAHRKFHYYLRRAQTTNNRLLRLYYRLCFSHIRDKLHLDIFTSTQIGKGLYIGHPYGITINAKAKLGSNINIHKGVTIGQENRGRRKGVPTIGNHVWIGINATVVGNITIGDDVMIAPNSFVNCDVPSHSIVFGNPCVIKRRENATEDYINNTVD